MPQQSSTSPRLGSGGSRSHTVVSPLPGWLRRLVAYGLAVIVLSAVAWLLVMALLRVGLVAFAVLVALLLAALVAPLALWLRRWMPRSLAALISVLVLVGVPAGVGYLIYSRVMMQVQNIGPAVTEGIDRIRDWLVNGPLNVDPQRIDNLRTQAFDAAQQVLPSPLAGTTTAISVLTGLLLVVFAVFFLLKDGDTMWRWALGWVSRDHRERVDGAGCIAWTTLTAYVRGTALVALGDAIGIGIGLLVLGVPLWLSLTLLTFLGAFVPIIGATVAGAVAVLVTLFTNGPTDAVIVLGIVLLVQQLEGNVLQPLIMSGIVKLHPLVVVGAVTAGTLLLGIVGALLAVPIVAVGYRVVDYLSGHSQAEDDRDDDGDDGDDGDGGDDDGDGGDGGGHDSDGAGSRGEGGDHPPRGSTADGHSTRREHQHR